MPSKTSGVRRAGSTLLKRRSGSCWTACGARTASLSYADGKASPSPWYYVWSKEFLEAGKRRLAGDTARAATTDEVKGLRREAGALKEVVAEQAVELRLLKKSMIADGGDPE